MPARGKSTRWLRGPAPLPGHTVGGMPTSAAADAAPGLHRWPATQSAALPGRRRAVVPRRGAVTVGLTSAAYAPTGEPPIGELTAQGADEGGGNNIVNVILTDIRALDTLGEILVLAVVAIGMIALVQAGRNETAEGRTS